MSCHVPALELAAPAARPPAGPDSRRARAHTADRSARANVIKTVHHDVCLSFNRDTVDCELYPPSSNDLVLEYLDLRGDMSADRGALLHERVVSAGAGCLE